MSDEEWYELGVQYLHIRIMFIDKYKDGGVIKETYEPGVKSGLFIQQISEVAKQGPGVYDIELPSNVGGTSFLKTGEKVQ
ncbi:hypothetical protein PAECIP111893_02097 [Paenibacillus plantiphilus]|uniref:Uncharacterized protein n=1 Tax=Paenibacillus plantiphilus TaxID=2905650 RepID=A0ABN8G9U4_9BACL|nr:hypothetical protein [Paenibacillus plantiphilus]CAH1203869.1 hypothetical protein PAECIP111893_02097 [Paenibacillus plantiphilus]